MKPKKACTVDRTVRAFFLPHTDLSDIVKQYPEKLRKYTYFVN